MLFIDFYFLFAFLPAILGISEIVQRHFSGRRAEFLLLASLCFYGFWSIPFAVMLGAYMYAGFGWGKLIHKKAGNRCIFASAIIFSLLPLLYFKYSLFLAAIFTPVTHGSWLYKGILPLGISFFTFTQIAYLTGVYQKRYPAETSLARYGFFFLFFPHLVAGPIIRYDELVPQLDRTVPRTEWFYKGLVYFLIGFAKKFFIADAIALFVNPLFDPWYAVNGFEDAVTATLGYTLQLYFDFSGYSDMAVGLALLLGFQLPINFDSPYKSSSISEFWRRWHMTLSRFLWEFIYVPLGGSRRSDLATYRNLFLTLLIAGIWHGAGWTFMMWGAMHGLAVVTQRIWSRSVVLPEWMKPATILLTFVFVALAWVIFRSSSLEQAMWIYSRFGQWTPFTFNAHISWLLFGGGLLFAPNSHRIVQWLDDVSLASIKAWFYRFLSLRMPIYASACWLLVIVLMALFYGTAFDRQLYPSLPVNRMANAVDHRTGDYRSNLFINEMFTGDEQKILFVGSSFTRFLGIFRFEYKGISYKSGPISNSGNSIVQGLRGAMEAIDAPHADTIVMSITPLNFLTADTLSNPEKRQNLSTEMGPFPLQCEKEFEELNIPVGAGKFDSCHPVNLTVADYIGFAHAGSKQFYQFHGFLAKLHEILKKDSFTPFDYVPPQPIDLSENGRNIFYSAWEKKIAGNRPNPIMDISLPKQLFADHTFPIEVLQPGGVVYEAMKRLAEKARSKHIRLVLYDTPILTNPAGQPVYPAGLLKAYFAAVEKMRSDLGITYFNLSGFFPESGEYMIDGVHPFIEMRKILHQHLLYLIFEEHP